MKIEPQPQDCSQSRQPVHFLVSTVATPKKSWLLGCR